MTGIGASEVVGVKEILEIFQGVCGVRERHSEEVLGWKEGY